ncbi:unnamed protein product [Acanthocheilonema viteae]|uniref:Uncharacterized protein n=1 Tax=Acanthocheilonema viteae TaxID=6277 RepID=A0A498S5H0_ACAVI|nr:unnamed protein product [Acanthocheilonema viteae]
MNRKVSSGNNDLNSFQPISSHLKEQILNPLTASIDGLTGSLECHESDPESNPELQFLKDSLVVVKPLMSSKTTEKPSSTSNIRIGKEVVFTASDLNLITGNHHMERPIPRKHRSFLDGSNQFTTGCNAFSPLTIQTSEMITGKRNNESICNTTETDNEIIELRAQIDSLYSKLNEIQRKCDQNSQEHKKSMLKNNNNINDTNNDSYGYLKIANENAKSISCVPNENPQIYQFITNSNGRISLEEKKLEQSGELCDIWEKKDQFDNTELITPRNCQEKTLNEMKADEEIVLVECSEETAEEQLKNDDQNSIDNHLDKCNSVTATETNRNCQLQSFDDRRLEQKEDKLKDQYSNSASYKLETKDTIIAVKRIKEYWDATCLSPSQIKLTKENLDCINLQHQHEKNKPCFPPANHPIQSSTSIIGFQQPRIAFQPPVRFAPMLCFPNIPTSAENHPYFPPSYNPFSQSEPVQFLSPNQLPKQFIPTMTTPMQAFQQRPNPLLNVQFSNPINATTNCSTINSLPQNSYSTKRKLPFKNGVLPAAKKKLMNSKSRNASAQTIPSMNGLVNVPNSISFDHLTKEQSIATIKNPFCSMQLPTCQQMMNMKEQSIPMANLETLPRNSELQQIANTCNAVTMPQPAMMNNYNCFI